MNPPIGSIDNNEMMTLVALIVTTFLMPQPASAVSVLVAATSSGAPAGLSLAWPRGRLAQPRVIVKNLDPLPSPIAPVRLRPVGSGLVATIGFAATQKQARRSGQNATTSRVDKTLGSHLISIDMSIGDGSGR